jgi:hypothetical protein
VDRDIHLIFVLNLKHNQNVYKDLENWRSLSMELSPLRLKIQLYQLLVRNGFFENGTKRSSNQSKAKEFTQKTVLARE